LTSEILTRLRDTRGTAVVEAALVTAILGALALAVIEFGNAYSQAHTLTSLSREGANIAARGTPLSDAVDIVMANGNDVALSTRGGAVGSRIDVVDGTAEVSEQVASSGYAGRSMIGEVGDPAQGVGGWNLVDGQTIYVMELFLDYQELTPFAAFAQVALPEVLYERAIF
jgi:Flp pilus assembly protein TadG